MINYAEITQDNEGSNYGVCNFCGLSFGDHETTCPYGEPSGYDVDPDPAARGREEDRTYERG